MKTIKLLIVALLITLSSKAQEIKVDLDLLLEQTQHTVSNNDKITITWWIPIEFWETTFAEDNSMSQDQKDEMIKLLRPFVMFAVVDGDVGPMGGIEYPSVKSIKKSFEVVDRNQVVYNAIDEQKLPNDIQILLGAFKPVLKNMLGELGENMNFFVVDDLDKKGNRIFDTKSTGTIGVNFLDNKTSFATPLSCLLAKKICPTDNAEHNGSWKFCPFHGDELIQK